MEFKFENTQDARPLIFEDLPCCLRDLDGSTFMLVKPDGWLCYARCKSEKDKLVDKMNPEDVVIFAWHGQWRTDMFVITHQEILKHYRKSKDAL